MSTHLPAVMERLDSRVLLSGGDPDPAFNHGGLVNTQFPGGSSEFTDVETLSDGSILAAGTLSVVGGATDQTKLVLAKYRFDGSLDPNFGSGGMIVNTPRGVSSARQLALTGDGGFVVLGSGETLLKFKSTGRLDRSFGHDGRLVPSNSAQVVVVDPQGRLMVGGSRNNPGAIPTAVDVDAVLQRYTASGVLDTTFNNTGEFVDPVTVFGEADNQTKMFRSIAFDKQGRIIAAEYFFSGDGGDPDGLSFQSDQMFRFSDDGTVDASYGRVQINKLRQIARVLDDGSLILFGRTIAKVDPTGKQLDPSYGNNGVANTTKLGPFAGGRDQAAVSPDGSVIYTVVLANQVDNILAPTLELTRLTAQGQTDTSFGTAGAKVVAQDVSGYLESVELSPDGTLVFAGQSGALSSDTHSALIGRMLLSEGPAVQLVPRVLRTASPSIYINLMIRDSAGVDLNTLDDDDLKLIDPVGGTRRFRLVSTQDVNGVGTYIIARYRISAPGNGGWTSANNGVYQMRLARKQIADNDGNYAMGQALGTVGVKIV